MGQKNWEKERYVLFLKSLELSLTVTRMSSFLPCEHFVKSRDLEFTQRDTETHGAWLSAWEFRRRTKSKNQGYPDTGWRYIWIVTSTVWRDKAPETRIPFSFLLPPPKRLFNSLFTHLAVAHSNNSPWAWILLRHCLSYSVLSCFHNVRGWLSGLSGNVQECAG